MENYIVRQEELTGDLVKFPLEIVQEMVNEQIRQGNKANVKIFTVNPFILKEEGGFTWNKSKRGIKYWDKVTTMFLKESEEYNEQNKSNFTPTYHAIEVSYKGSTATQPSKIKIRSERFNETVFIPYNNSSDLINISGDYLASKLFTIMGISEWKNGSYIFAVNEFKSIK